MKMVIRQVLAVCVVFLMCQSAVVTQRPNIVLIVADDLVKLFNLDL